MLEYMIEATVDIVSLMIIMGAASAYVANNYTVRLRKLFTAAWIAGIAAAAWMAWMKNATNLIRTSALNLRLYYIIIASFAVFIIFTILEKKLGNKGKAVTCVSLSVYIFVQLFMLLPDFIAYPYTLKVAETTVFSSSYILKLTGVVLGFVLTLIACFAANRTAKRLSAGWRLAFIVALLSINQFKQFGSMLASMISNRVISNHDVFTFAVFIVNRSDYFIYLTLAVSAAAAVIMIIKGMHVREPYTNPAEHRKIRAKWRTIRKWSAAGIACAVISVLLMTAVDSVVNAEIQLSPTEEATVVGNEVVVLFTDVDDGHLHRFGYTTENGVEVRFIIIQKPNSSSYGVGMDCCDICGETGYYEDGDGNVICNRCDVVMNINTIGFAGGCNPKVVEYTVSDGKIIIPVEQLEQYEKDFS